MYIIYKTHMHTHTYTLAFKVQNTSLEDCMNHESNNTEKCVRKYWSSL